MKLKWEKPYLRFLGGVEEVSKGCSPYLFPNEQCGNGNDNNGRNGCGNGNHNVGLNGCNNGNSNRKDY